MINISKLNKAEVLATLYNHSRQQGLGILIGSGIPMSIQEAGVILASGQTYFDYLNGRVMKADLSEDEFSEGLYDRDNGDGAAAKAIASMGTKGLG